MRDGAFADVGFFSKDEAENPLGSEFRAGPQIIIAFAAKKRKAWSETRTAPTQRPDRHIKVKISVKNVRVSLVTVIFTFGRIQILFRFYLLFYYLFSEGLPVLDTSFLKFSSFHPDSCCIIQKV